MNDLRRALCTAAAVLLAVAAHTAIAQPVVRESRTVEVDGVEREFLLLVPAVLPAAPLALVFNFHGSGSTSDAQVANSDFERSVAENGFIAVLPQGAYMNTRSPRSWNADLDPSGVDDVELVRNIIADVSRDFRVDTARIYSTGFSGGARMTSRLACELSGTFAAAAPVGGIQFGAGCAPERAIPILTFHGKADRVNQYERNAESPPYWVAGVEQSIGGWVGANRCAAEAAQESVAPGVVHHVWDDCADGAVVEAWIIDDGGHTWPGSPLVREVERLGVTNHDIDATDLIWEFFSRYRLSD